MSSKRYLQRLVRVKVHKSLQSVVGNTHIRKALHTRDLDEANRRKWAMVDAIKSELSRLKGYDPLSMRAHQWRQDIRKAITSGNNDLADTLESFVIDEAEKLHQQTGDLDRAKEWFTLATTEAKTLDELIDTWLASTDYTEQTKHQHRKAYEELKQFLGGERLARSVTDDLAVSYVEEHIKKSEQSYETQRRKLNSLIAFWNWLGLRKHVPRGFNPWRGFKISKQRTPKKTATKRPYMDDELIKLFSGKTEYHGLAEVMVLGLYTGCRIEEICALKVIDVSKNGNGIFFINITNGKTEKSIIAVAHPLPCSILESRLNRHTEGTQQLFPEFKAGGYDGKFSWHVSKAFGRYRDKAGLTKATDFHSFRRTLITLMENSGTDQVRIARYVGHTLPTIAFMVYSGGSTENTNIEVAKQIRYPKPVEDAVRNFLEG